MAKKEKWIQKSAEQIKEKGTEGSFTRWCKEQGFDGVTVECIRKGLRSKDSRIRKKALWAQNVRASKKKS